MDLHVFLFLLVVCLLFFLALLWRLYWFPLRPSSSRGGAKRSRLHRLLKPRCPDDRPACRLGSTASSDGGPAPAPVRPWSEVKSRRGAPKRIPTEGFACPNQKCAYFGITEAHIHALVGDGKHGRAEQIQTFRCQACCTTFTSRRHTPLYRLKTPSHHVARVLSALAEGLDPSEARRVFGYRHATIITWMSRAGEHAQTLHQHSFCNLHLPHLQLDELRTRLRCAKQVLWLWLATHPLAATEPGSWLHPALYQRWLKFLLLCADGSFWTLSPSGSERAEGASVAGGSKPDLRPGEEKLPTAEAGTRLARDASWNRGRSQSRLTGTGPLWKAQHRLY